MTAYASCKWCDGRGCNQCNYERKKDKEKWEKEGPQPIFTAKLDNPDDMAALKRVCGGEVLEEAFGEGGEGIRRIELQGAIESMLQLLRKQNKETNI